MDDKRLDELIDAVRGSYRRPPEPPLDAMWREVEAELDARPMDTASASPARVAGAWRAISVVAAAALVAGIGVGRWTARADLDRTVAAMGTVPMDSSAHLIQLSQPLQRTTTSFLGETALLLQQLQRDSRGAYSAQASTLLATTRLLLDSPAASDERLFALLEDLELILAQIATLRNGEGNARSQQELQLIRSVLAENDVVPRVHSAAVSLASFDD